MCLRIAESQQTYETDGLSMRWFIVAFFLGSRLADRYVGCDPS
jgi:hypothetical protein